MKRTILFFFTILLLSLAGCGKEPESEPVSTTAPYVLSVLPEDRNQAFTAQGFVETPEGYYYGIPKAYQGGLVYFCPRGGTAFRPLCGKPNCKHEDSDCNAWYDGMTFGYYNGALYTLEIPWEDDDYKLVKFNLDGTDHAVVAKVKVDTSKPYSYNYTFHHGKLFLYGSTLHTTTDGTVEDHLYVVDLSDYSQKEIASEFFQTGSVLRFKGYFRDKLYGQATSDKLADYDDNGLRLVEIDANTGEARTLVSKPAVSSYATDDTLYYFQPDVEAIGYEIGKVEPGFRELDLATGAVKDCGMPASDILNARYDEDFIYAGSFLRNDDQDYTVYFLSRDYQLLDQIELTEGQYIVNITSDRIFFSDKNPLDSKDRGDTDEANLKLYGICYYIDKSEIGSHAIALKPMETVR